MLTLPDESEKNPTGQILKNPWRGESGAEGVCGEVSGGNRATMAVVLSFCSGVAPLTPCPSHEEGERGEFIVFAGRGSTG
jgi:hypothetical protein